MHGSAKGDKLETPLLNEERLLYNHMLESEYQESFFESLVISGTPWTTQFRGSDAQPSEIQKTCWKTSAPNETVVNTVICIQDFKTVAIGSPAHYLRCH